MTVSRSPRLGLFRWSSDEDPWDRSQFDADNAALEDRAALDRQGTLAERGAPDRRGEFFTVVDPTAAEHGQMFRATGTEWRLINGLPPHNLLLGLKDGDPHSQYLTRDQHFGITRRESGYEAHGTTNVDHGMIFGLGDDDHQQYLNSARHAALHSTAGATVTIDHGTLTGLVDDDHPQYLTAGRGDGRYIPRSQMTASGDLLVGGGASVVQRLPRGPVDTVLRVLDNGTVGWAPAPGRARESARTVFSGPGAFGSPIHLHGLTWAGAPRGLYRIDGTAVISTGSGTTAGTLMLRTNGGVVVEQARLDLDTFVRPWSYAAFFEYGGGDLFGEVVYAPNSVGIGVHPGTKVMLTFLG